jgi:hypothetical protein
MPSVSFVRFFLLIAPSSSRERFSFSANCYRQVSGET